MEMIGPLPCSREPTTCSYPEPNEFSPKLPFLFLSDPFSYHPLIYVQLLPAVPVLHIFPSQIESNLLVNFQINLFSCDWQHRILITNLLLMTKVYLVSHGNMKQEWGREQRIYIFFGLYIYVQCTYFHIFLCERELGWHVFDRKFGN